MDKNILWSDWGPPTSMYVPAPSVDPLFLSSFSVPFINNLLCLCLVPPSIISSIHKTARWLYDRGIT